MLNSRQESNGFTVIEILLVVVVIGIVATIGFPRMIRREPSSEWKHVHQELNNMILFAKQEAISHQAVYRLVLLSQNEDPDRVSVEREENGEFIPVRSEYFHTTYDFPPSISFQGVFLGKEEQLEKQKRKAFCYIIPDGLVQDVLLHMQRDDRGVMTPASFKMKPFLGEFELYEELIKPV